MIWGGGGRRLRDLGDMIVVIEQKLTWGVANNKIIIDEKELNWSFNNYQLDRINLPSCHSRRPSLADIIRIQDCHLDRRRFFQKVISRGETTETTSNNANIRRMTVTASVRREWGYSAAWAPSMTPWSNWDGSRTKYRPDEPEQCHTMTYQKYEHQSRELHWVFSLNHTILLAGCISLKGCGRQIDIVIKGLWWLPIADDDDDCEKDFQIFWWLAENGFVTNGLLACLLVTTSEYGCFSSSQLLMAFSSRESYDMYDTIPTYICTRYI